MKRTAACKELQAGFTPLPSSRTRVWNRLQTKRRGIGERPTVRWAVAACVMLITVWSAAVWTPRSREPMRAALTANASFNQRYGEAGPRGQEYNPHYLPFQ